MRALAPRRRWLIAVAAVLVLAGALSAAQALRAGHLALPAREAIARVRADPAAFRGLSARADRAIVLPSDASEDTVVFLHGPRILLEAGVDRNGAVVDVQRWQRGVLWAGGRAVNSAWVLGALSVLFLLATMVTPLLRLRNLDALVAASAAGTIALGNGRLLVWSVLSATLVLAYLVGRAATVGLRADARTAAPARPLLEALLDLAPAAARRWLLTALLVVVAGAFSALTLTAHGYLDVASASLQGATELLHGILPYGNITVAGHGDTYPLLNYVLFVPGAAVLPHLHLLDSLGGAHIVTLAAALLGAGGVALGAARAAGAGASRSLAGARGALAWLTFAPVLVAAADGTNDIVLGAMVAWLAACGLRRRSALLVIVAGAWTKAVPVLLLPMWLARVPRGERLRALMPAALLSAALLVLLVALGGPSGPGRMIDAMTFQFQRGSEYVPWFLFGVRWLQPLAQAGLCALVALAVVRTRAGGLDSTRLAALGAAVLLGAQLVANYWTASYLVWALPLLATGLFGAGSSVAASAAVPARSGRASGGVRVLAGSA